ncbi:MAG: tetratricopeptide repeat protein [Myxococcaceae bacterium]|nr:tetratricopeptide repeat protein [Myxococcaceae bacterium]
MAMETGALRDTLTAVVRGEVTLAELQGLTYEQARAIAQVGCELSGAGRLEEARILFKGLVAMNPKDAGVHAALGTVYQRLGRNEEARASYDAALAQAPRNPVALANRGELRLRSGDVGGLEDLTHAVEADPEGRTRAGSRARGLLEATSLAHAQRHR